MWTSGRWLVVVWSLSACTSGAVWEAVDGASLPPGRHDQPFATPVLVDSEPLPLPAHQRRWLVDVQITMRWTRQLVDTVADWWSTETLRDLERDLAVAEAEIDRFVLRHHVPRLASAWSPINDADSLPARRYDDMMRRATSNPREAEQQVLVARDLVVAQLELADRTHLEIGLLVPALVEHLTR